MKKRRHSKEWYDAHLRWCAERAREADRQDAGLFIKQFFSSEEEEDDDPPQNNPPQDDPSQSA